MSPRTPEATRAVYVRLPLDAAEKLDRAAAERGASKRDVIASLLDATSPREALQLGHARFTPASAAAVPEVLTLEEAAELLRVDLAAALALIESGDLPARKIGDEWRLRRDALLDWLAPTP